MIVGIENIKDFIRTSDFQKFAVSMGMKPDDRRVFTRNIETEYEEELIRLEKILKLNGRAEYFLAGSVNPNDNKWQYTGIKIFYNGEMDDLSQPIQQTTQMPAVGVIPDGYISIDEVEKRINDSLEKERNSRKMEELESELNYYKEQDTEEKQTKMEILNKVLPLLDPIISGIMKNFVPNQISRSAIVAGTTTKEMETEFNRNNSISQLENNRMKEEEKVLELVERFMVAEPNYMKMLEKVVEMAEKQDNTYIMAKQFLGC